MRILLIGFIAFFLWSAFSTYIYVCKIKGLCYETSYTQNDTLNHKVDGLKDSIIEPIDQKQLMIPDSFITYFAFDKSEFKTDTKSEQYVDETNTYMNQNSQCYVNIIGHTDAIGSINYNQSLGYRRAQRMREYFQGLGVPGTRIQINSMGETEPADKNNTQIGRANNRRTVITFKNK